MHDVPYGWLIRLMHLNGASFFFIFIYFHILRGIYYKSFQTPRTNIWFSGVLLYFLVMGTAFLGYVLPWGQMSYWAATVITNLVTVLPFIGKKILYWIWGGFSINNATLNRFFCLHYLLPFIIIFLILLHLIMLHKTGSSNELKIKSSFNLNTMFFPFFIIKDLFIFILYVIFYSIFVFFYPEFFNHSINYIPANPMVTPEEIVPEWYFLPFYAILRSILEKNIGIFYMFFSIAILFLIPKIDYKKLRFYIHNEYHKTFFWFFVMNFIFLGFLGSEPIYDIGIFFSIICSYIHIHYFLVYFLFI